MAQARRISHEYKGKTISRKTLSTLKAIDFEVNASNQIEKENKKTIGFVV